MKHLLTILIFLPLFCSAQVVTTYDTTGGGLLPSDTVGRASYYGGSMSGTINYGDVSELHAVSLGKGLRANRAGTIRKVEFHTGQLPDNLQDFRVKVWRWDYASTWTLIGQSENIAGRLGSNQDNSISLSSPIDSVQMWDYIGYSFKAPGNTSDWLVGAQWQGNTRFESSNPGMYTDWLNSSGYAYNTALPLRVYMDAPMLVSIGTSITSGYNTNAAVSDYQSGETDRFNDFTYLIGQALGISVVNQGFGGSQTWYMKERFANDVAALHPKIVLIEGMHNDITGYDPLSKEPYQHYAASISHNLDSVLIQTAALPALSVYLFGIPSNGYDDQMSRTADSVDNHIASVIGSYGGVIVNVSGLGEYRASGPSGNKWQLKSVYTSDGTHLNHAGDAYIVAQVTAQIQSRLSAGGQTITTHVSFTTLPTEYSSESAAQADNACVRCIYTVTGSSIIHVKK